MEDIVLHHGDEREARGSLRAAEPTVIPWLVQTAGGFELSQSSGMSSCWYYIKRYRRFN